MGFFSRKSTTNRTSQTTVNNIQHTNKQAGGHMLDGTNNSLSFLTTDHDSVKAAFGFGGEALDFGQSVANEAFDFGTDGMALALGVVGDVVGDALHFADSSSRINTGLVSSAVSGVSHDVNDSLSRSITTIAIVGLCIYGLSLFVKK